ncbi:MAG: ATP-binding protein [Kiritimatiellae bacterium]|nr:ATP-binding protein [Kiritimatiellia bacterium]
MFIGREKELELLDALWGRDSGVLVTCRGRRRIGKSTLIEEFAARSAARFLSIEGLAPHKRMTDAVQRRRFCEKVAEYAGRPVEDAANWSLAFAQLDGLLAGDRRTVVLLDEISWMGGWNPDFPGYLKEAWDKRLRKHANLVLVLCGSVSAWIAENILDSTGFVGRNSLDIELRELPLRDAVRIWGPGAERMSTREKLDLLSVVGGVQKYLEEVRPALSVDENVRRMCFLPDGILFRDFDETFNQVFGRKAKLRGRILRELVARPRTVAEVAGADGTPTSGAYSKTLEDLRHAGYVARDEGLNPLTGKSVRKARFRVCDNYVRFYLHYVEPRRKAIERGLFAFSSLEQLQGLQTFFGLQFENLVLNHVGDLFPLLGLDRSLVLSAFSYVQAATKRLRGCQIDLLVQTQRTLVVVEIKRRLEIGREIIGEVSEKVSRLAHDKSLSVRTALVYDGRLSPGVLADRFFDFVIPAEKLLS